VRIVLDTNVLVSGLINPHGTPGDIVRLALGGAIVPCHDARILHEYREVLARPRFGIPAPLADALLEQLRDEGAVEGARPLRVHLPDRDDEAFLEVALAGGVQCLVTGNLRHYPVHARQGMKVLDPREFMAFHRSRAEPG